MHFCLGRLGGQLLLQFYEEATAILARGGLGSLAASFYYDFIKNALQFCVERLERPGGQVLLQFYEEPTATPIVQ